MKVLIMLAIAIAIALAALMNWTSPITTAEPAATEPAGQTRAMNISLEGMVCLACVAKVNQTLTALDGVDKASADLAKQKVSVAYDPNRIDRGQIVEAIRKLGYRPEEPERQEVE